jgi:hypothetical protein
LSLNREEILRSSQLPFVTQEEEIPLSPENLSGNRDVIFPSTQTTFESRGEILPSEQTSSFSGGVTPSSIEDISESEQLPFTILDETIKSFPKYNTTGRSLLMKFHVPSEDNDPAAYLRECITALTNYLVDKVPDRDLVGLKIRNTENLQDKLIGISLRRRDQLKPDVVLSVTDQVIQSNTRFGLTDRLEVHLDHVTMPVGSGGVKTKGRSLDVLWAIKKSIVVVKAVMNCLAYALVIAIAQCNDDPKYGSYRNGYCLKNLLKKLKASGVDLTNGGGLEKLQQFQQYLSNYKIIVIDGLKPERLF